MELFYFSQRFVTFGVMDGDMCSVLSACIAAQLEGFIERDKDRIMLHIDVIDGIKQ